jgi:hypothetical protein
VRKTTKPDKEIAEDAALLRRWRTWHREELDAARAEQPELIAELMSILGGLDLGSASTLVSFARRIDWAAVSYPVRLVALHEINVAIMDLREQHGLIPLDDPLPSERDSKNVFQAIRTILGVGRA